MLSYIRRSYGGSLQAASMDGSPTPAGAPCQAPWCVSTRATVERRSRQEVTQAEYIAWKPSLPGEYLLEAEDTTSMLAVSESILLEPSRDLEHDIELKIRSLRTEVLVTASSTPLPLDEVAKARTS